MRSLRILTAAFGLALFASGPVSAAALPVTQLRLVKSDLVEQVQFRRGGGGYAGRGFASRGPRGGMAGRGFVARGPRGGAVAGRGFVARGPYGGAVAGRGYVARGPRGNVVAGRGVYARPGYRPVGPWVRPAAYWWHPGMAIASGAAIGFVTAAAANAYANSQAPAPGYCWFYTNPQRTQGFWDVCP